MLLRKNRSYHASLDWEYISTNAKISISHIDGRVFCVEIRTKKHAYTYNKLANTLTLKKPNFTKIVASGKKIFPYLKEHFRDDEWLQIQKRLFEVV